MCKMKEKRPVLRRSMLIVLQSERDDLLTLMTWLMWQTVLNTFCSWKPPGLTQYDTNRKPAFWVGHGLEQRPQFPREDLPEWEEKKAQFWAPHPSAPFTPPGPKKQKIGQMRSGQMRSLPKNLGSEVALDNKMEKLFENPWFPNQTKSKPRSWWNGETRCLPHAPAISEECSMFIDCVPSNWRQRNSDQDDHYKKESYNETRFQDSQSCNLIGCLIELILNTFDTKNQTCWHFDQKKFHAWWVESSLVFVKSSLVFVKHQPFQFYRLFWSNVERTQKIQSQAKSKPMMNLGPVMRNPPAQSSAVSESPSKIESQVTLSPQTEHFFWQKNSKRLCWTNNVTCLPSQLRNLNRETMRSSSHRNPLHGSDRLPPRRTWEWRHQLQNHTDFPAKTMKTPLLRHTPWECSIAEANKASSTFSWFPARSLLWPPPVLWGIGESPRTNVLPPRSPRPPTGRDREAEPARGKCAPSASWLGPKLLRWWRRTASWLFRRS